MTMMKMKTSLRYCRNSSSSQGFRKGSGKVAILGAAGGIGQPLSLLLKADSQFLSDTQLGHLALYDIANVGMTADLAHISTNCKVSGHSGPEQLQQALEGAEVVVIPAGVPRKPGMTRDDLFNVNANIVKTLSLACAKHCPNAHLLVISNPVNSTVPIAFEIMRNALKDANATPNVVGVTTLDLLRARTFVGEALGVTNPHKLVVPVIGGHSGSTIVPLLSQVNVEGILEKLQQKSDSLSEITKRIQFGGDEVVKAKNGAGSATLSMAAAAKEFIGSYLRGLGGEVNVSIAFYKDPAKFSSTLGYFAGPVLLGPKGIQQSLDLPPMTPFEKQLFEVAVNDLKKDVQKGLDFASQVKN